MAETIRIIRGQWKIDRFGQERENSNPDRDGSKTAQSGTSQQIGESYVKAFNSSSNAQTRNAVFVKGIRLLNRVLRILFRFVVDILSLPGLQVENAVTTFGQINDLLG